jgi:hypothetical protein
LNTKSSTIIIISNEAWSDVWFSKQHYANELSFLGHKVFFINSPQYWRPWHLLSFTVKRKMINENLFILNYKNNFPVRIFKRIFLKLNDFLNSWKIAKAVKEQEIIWWQFDPFRFVDIYFFEKVRRIYHVVDPFQHIWSDKEIAKKANLLVSVSNYYKDHYSKYNKSFLYIPHGISAIESKWDLELSEEVKKKYGNNYIVFVGTINIDVNLVLLQELASTLKEQRIIIIGPLIITGSDRLLFHELCALPNVTYLNRISSETLKNYISQGKVGIVPYKKKRTENIHRTPLKIMNYIENNLPVVTTLNYELTELNNKCIFVSDSNEEFIEIVDKIVKGNLLADQEMLMSYKNKIRYNLLIKRILEELYH